jgi:hypothetical protein
VSGVAEIDTNSSPHVKKRPLELDDLLASRTTLGELIQRLALRRFYFLLMGGELRQIVTVSDLNRLPVRVFLFTLLSHLEGILVDLILEELSDDRWRDMLSERQRAKASELYAEKRAVDIDTRPIDCTTLTNKLEIIAKHPSLRKRFGAETRREFEQYAQPVKELRNRLAHGMEPIEEGATEEEVMEIEHARDATLHQGRLSRRKDPAWLARVTATIVEMVDVGAADSGVMR